MADLNGDGKKEVLVATHDAKVQVKHLCLTLSFLLSVFWFVFVDWKSSNLSEEKFDAH